MTKEAVKYLDVFIDDVIVVLEESEDIADFRLKFWQKHDVKFQWRMF